MATPLIQSLQAGYKLIAFESPYSERSHTKSLLQQYDPDIPLFCWDPSQSGKPLDGLSKEDLVKPYIALIEGGLEQFNQYELLRMRDLLCDRQFVIFMQPAIALPPPLVPEIPLVVDAVPGASEVSAQLQAFLKREPTIKEVQASTGLYLGQLLEVVPMILERHPPDQFVLKLNEYKVSQLDSKGLEAMGEPDVTVGGLDELEAYIDAQVKLLNPKAREFNLPLPKGIVLWGIPGTGKSLITKHAAKRMGLPLIAADWSKIIDPKDEAKACATLRFVLQVAEVISPCILAWDEFEKVNVEGALKGIILTWMQERKSPVFVVASCNRLGEIPPELVRPGRMDAIFFVDMPHAGARKAIFEIHLEKYYMGESIPYSKKEWMKLVHSYNNCTAAEIAEAVKQAAARAFVNGTPGVITFDELLKGRNMFNPSFEQYQVDIITEKKKATNVRKACSPDTSDWQLEPAPWAEGLDL